ncbi:hypothetical protein [Pseudomonas simiae]|uniref:hypothetical protein n=1 Tax=Pseudomonas simiae TaxID=321846 RepID=UPI000AC5B369|nr:hypothetical protein [Pseudomonas simiae]
MDYSKAYDAISDKMRSWEFEKLDEKADGFLLRYKLGEGSYDCSVSDPQKANPLVAGSFNGEVWVSAINHNVSQQSVDDALNLIHSQLTNNGQFERIRCLL